MVALWGTLGGDWGTLDGGWATCFVVCFAGGTRFSTDFPSTLLSWAGDPVDEETVLPAVLVLEWHFVRQLDLLANAPTPVDIWHLNPGNVQS